MGFEGKERHFAELAVVPILDVSTILSASCDAVADVTEIIQIFKLRSGDHRVGPLEELMKGSVMFDELDHCCVQRLHKKLTYGKLGGHGIYGTVGSFDEE